MFKSDHKNQNKMIDDLIKVANQTYFSHKEINCIDKQFLIADKKKDIKKMINSFKKSSNSNLLKISTKKGKLNIFKTLHKYNLFY